MPGGPNAQADLGKPGPSSGHVSAVPAVRPGSIPPHNPNSSPFSRPGQSNPWNLPFNSIDAFNNAQAPQPGGRMSNNPAAANPGPNMLNPSSFPMLQQYPPLAKDRFLVTYKNFCNKKRLVHDRSLLSSEDLHIDLYTLHSEVVREGGWGPVQQKDLWAVIAGRMGCVQLPGTPTEPPKSGPGVADRVAHVYKSYLAEFDRIYMNSVQNEYRRKFLLPQLSSSQLKGMNSQQIRMLVQVSDVPAAELRGKVPDEILRVLETNRQTLQLMKQDQNVFQTFLSAAQPSNPGVPIDPDVVGMPSQPPFNNSMQRIGGGITGLPPNDHQGSSIARRLHAALQEIQFMKQEYIPKIATLPPVEVSNVQRLEYNNLLEQVHRTSQEVERKLPFFHVALSAKNPNASSSTRKLVTHIINVQQQRQMVEFSTPRFILSLQDLRAAQSVFNSGIEYVATHWKAVATGGLTIPGNSPPTQPPNNPPGVVSQRSPQVFPSHPSLQGTSNSITHPPVNLQPPQHTTNVPTPTRVGLPQTGKSKAKSRATPKQPRTSSFSSFSNDEVDPFTEPFPIHPTRSNSLKRPREDDEEWHSMNGVSDVPTATAGSSSQASDPSSKSFPLQRKRSKAHEGGSPGDEEVLLNPWGNWGWDVPSFDEV
ncbi:hypothetical protein AAF712_015587 [Marasmius tenuissimus]|uniref:ARID domain-containing protein n=1 Tax=Marasmius tenuissimus TaxID=585030 RepID=A0ABR2Z938_9AGAR